MPPSSLTPPPPVPLGSFSSLQAVSAPAPLRAARLRMVNRVRSRRLIMLGLTSVRARWFHRDGSDDQPLSPRRLTQVPQWGVLRPHYSGAGASKPPPPERSSNGR